MAAPGVVVLDVNETLSDMAPMAGTFAEVGAAPHLAQLWFASVLRDGFALAATGTLRPFPVVAEGVLRVLLAGQPLDRPLDGAVEHVLAGMSALAVHDDVPQGVRLLRDAGFRLVTLSNGAADVAGRLLARAGLRDAFELLLSVEDAGLWKPSPVAYAYAARRCGVRVQDLTLVAAHPWDVTGAARAGASTAWVDRSGVPYPAHLDPPDVTGTSLPDVARRLADRVPTS